MEGGGFYNNADEFIVHLETVEVNLISSLTIVYNRKYLFNLPPFIQTLDSRLVVSGAEREVPAKLQPSLYFSTHQSYTVDMCGVLSVQCQSRSLSGISGGELRLPLKSK